MTSHAWSRCCGNSSPASSTGTLTRSHRRIPLPKVDILIRELFDLILLDMVMPRLGGLDLLKHVRDLGVKAPVLMMTGGRDTPEGNRGVDRGGRRLSAQAIKCTHTGPLRSSSPTVR